MLYADAGAVTSCMQYLPHPDIVSQTYHVRDVRHCLCKSVQKYANHKNAGITPPPYDVSSVYTSDADFDYYIGRGDFKNNRKSYIRKLGMKEKRQKANMQEPSWEPYSRYKVAKSIEILSDPVKTSHNRRFYKRKKVINEQGYDSKDYSYNYKPKKIGKRLQRNKPLLKDTFGDTLTYEPITSSIIDSHRKCRKNCYDIANPRKGKYNPNLHCKCFKNLSPDAQHQNKSGSDETNSKSVFIYKKDDIYSPSMKCKCTDRRPYIKLEIKPRSPKPCKKVPCQDVDRTLKPFECSRDEHGKCLKYLEGSGDVPLSIQHNYELYCKCYNKGPETGITDSVDETCNRPLSSTTTIRLKEKIMCLCNKYSKILKQKERTLIDISNLNEDVTGEDVSKNILINENCFCDDQTCNLSKDVLNYLNKQKLSSPPRQQSKKRQRLNSIYQCLKSKLVSEHENKDNICENMALQNLPCHRIDQTGEPFFEIKVDSNNMCVLNSEDIKNRVTALGKSAKIKSCICPSHSEEKKHILQKVACTAGICEKAFKDKNTNYKCKCIDNNIRKCDDSTCDGSYRTKCIPGKQNKPLFEVQLDSNSCCIINSEEIRNKLNNMKASLGNACITGICRNANKDKVRYICKCFQRKRQEAEDDECCDETCNTFDKPNKTDNRYNRMSRRKINITQLKHIKSKLSSIFDQIVSKSENSIAQNINQMNFIPTIKSSLDKVNEKRIRPCLNVQLNELSRSGAQSFQRDACVCCQCNLKPKTFWCKSFFSRNRSRYVVNRLHHKRKHFHRRNGLSLTSAVKEKDKNHVTGYCCICGEEKSNCDCNSTSEILRYKKMFCSTCLALIKSDRKRIKKLRREGFCIPLSNVKEPRNVKFMEIKDNQNFNEIIDKCNTNKDIKQSLSEQKHPENDYIQISRNGKVCLCSPICNGDPKIGKRLLFLKHKKRENQNRNENVCLCSHICECNEHKDNEKQSLFYRTFAKQNKLKDKHRQLKNKKRKQEIQKKHRKKSDSRKKRTNQRVANERKKTFLTEERKFQKQLKKKENIERKKKQKLFKMEQKQLEAISKGKEEAEETSCLADFFLGLLKCGVAITKKVVFVLYKIISDPKGSYRYIKNRIQDPVGTYERLKKIFTDSWRIKKLQMLKSIGGSEKMTILSDTLQSTALFEAFADKGKTKKEKRLIEEQRRKRKIRIQKRDKEALRSCRHMLLHTLRKHPCLWVYHVCPQLYPQCLGLLEFMRNFSHMVLFVFAFMVWTPCIICFEAARGMACCLLCTH